MMTVATALPEKLVTRPGFGHEPVDAHDEPDAVDEVGPVRLQSPPGWPDRRQLHQMRLAGIAWAAQEPGDLQPAEGP
jgi:hypothetical protein